MPTALGIAPERASTQITLSNADRALDRFLVGTSGRVGTSFVGSSFLDFRGKVFRVLVAADGTMTEIPYSPTMIVAGPIDDVPGEVHLTLAVDDSHVFAASESIKPLSHYLEATEYAPSWNSAPLRGYFKIPNRNPATYPWDRLSGAAIAQKLNREVSIPWIYGNTPVRLIKVAKETETWYVAGIIADADPIINLEYRLVAEDNGKLVEILPEIENGIWNFLVDFGPNETLVCFCAIKPENKYLEKDLWLLPSLRPAWNPVHMVRQLIVDHSKGGLAAIDTASLNAAVSTTSRYTGCIAGVYEDSSSVAGVLENIAPLVGLRTWIGVDDKLHFSVLGISKAELGSDISNLPEIVPSDDYPRSTDGFPSWRGTLPTDPDDPGAALSRVTLEWPEILTKIFPAETNQDRSSYTRKTKLAGEVEQRLKGDWIDPLYAGPLIQAVLSRSARPTRTAEIATHASVATIPIGSLVRVTHPFGAGGWDRRLARLLGVEVRPAEHAAIATLEDLGPVEDLRPGKLDTLSNWITQNWNGSGIKLTLSNEYAQIQTSSTVFASSMVGGTVWVQGSANPAANRSYKIVSVPDGKTAIVSPIPPVNEVINASPSGTPLEKSAWLIVHTQTTKGPGFREGYIRGANLVTGKFDDGTDGFQFLRN